MLFIVCIGLNIDICNEHISKLNKYFYVLRFRRKPAVFYIDLLTGGPDTARSTTDEV